MSLADWLEADVGLLGSRLQQGFAWWVDELSALARPLAKPGGVSSLPLVAHWREPGAYQLWRSGREEHLHRRGDGRIRAAVALPVEMVLVRKLSRPDLPERDLRRLTVLDLDRLTPFPGDSIYYDIAVLPGVDAEGRRQVRLAVTPRTQADLFLADAQASGVEATAVVAADDGKIIDFLPVMRGRGTGTKRGSFVWGMVAMLLASNLAAAIWRDVQATDTLREAVATQEPVVARIEATRRQMRALQQQATEHAIARAKGEPLRVLDALSQALPKEAWAQRLSWDGASVRLVGQQQENVDVIGALRHNPLFTSVHSSDAAAPPSVAGFDVVADVATPTLPKKR